MWPGRATPRPPSRCRCATIPPRPALVALAASRPHRVCQGRSDHAPSRCSAARLRHAEQAHDSEAIGLAHYELGLCYKQVGDSANRSRAHRKGRTCTTRRRQSTIPRARSTRFRACVLAQSGRIEEATTAFRQAEQLATAVHAADVLGMISKPGERRAHPASSGAGARALRAEAPPCRNESARDEGLAISLATLGSDSRTVGQLERAEKVLHRALEVRGPNQFTRSPEQCTTARADRADAWRLRVLQRISASGRRRLRRLRRPTSLWYEWSIRVLEAKLAARRGDDDGALRLAEEIATEQQHPLPKPFRPSLSRAKRCWRPAARRMARDRLSTSAARIDARAMPGAWGEFLRLRGAMKPLAGGCRRRITTSRRARACSS